MEIGLHGSTWNFVVLNFQLLKLLDFITPSGKDTEIEFFMLSNISILFLHFKEIVLAASSPPILFNFLEDELNLIKKNR